MNNGFSNEMAPYWERIKSIISNAGYGDDFLQYAKEHLLSEIARDGEKSVIDIEKRNAEGFMSSKSYIDNLYNHSYRNGLWNPDGTKREKGTGPWKPEGAASAQAHTETPSQVTTEPIEATPQARQATSSPAPSAPTPSSSPAEHGPTVRTGNPNSENAPLQLQEGKSTRIARAKAEREKRNASGPEIIHAGENPATVEARMLDWGAKTGPEGPTPAELQKEAQMENWGAQKPQEEPNLYEQQAEEQIKKEKAAATAAPVKERAKDLYLGSGFKNASKGWDAADAAEKARAAKAGQAYGQALGAIRKSGTKDAANNNMVASLQAAKEAGVSDDAIFSGGKQLGNRLAKEMGLKRSGKRFSPGKQLSSDLEAAKNAMTALEAEQARAHKKYDGIIETVGDKKKWDSMSNLQKMKAIGMNKKQAARMNRSTQRFSKARSLFGKVVDSVKSVKDAVVDRHEGLSFRENARSAYSAHQSQRLKDSINSNTRLGTALDEIGRRKAARGDRVISAANQAVEDLKAKDYKAAQMINDIKNGKSARSVVQRANPEMMKRKAAEESKAGKFKLGWKGKAGAVAALLGAGAILGNMMGNHGEQSNAQLYNPNPQAQYAN